MGSWRESIGWAIGLVAAAGAVGALARWGLSLSFARLQMGPAGTLVANVAGCLIFGIVTWWARRHAAADDELWRLVLLVGFCGALTTFSGLAGDCMRLVESGPRGPALAAGLLAAHLAAGFAALVAGIAVARWLS
jgi:CrcB protein